VGLDLRGEHVLAEAEASLDDRAGERFPVDVGVGREVGVEVADRAVELGGQGDGVELGGLAAQAVDEDGQLLAERGGRGRLAVGARQHGRAAHLVGQARERVGERLLGGAQHTQAVAQHQGEGQIVDILRGAGKVHELAERRERGTSQTLFDEVLDRLDIVIGDGLDRLDTARIFHREALGQSVEEGAFVSSQGAGLGDAGGVAQRVQPGDLHSDASLDQSVFRKDRAQQFQFRCVAPI